MTAALTRSDSAAVQEVTEQAHHQPALQREFTDAERKALAAAQKTLFVSRENDLRSRTQLAESRLCFGRELRANAQSSLFQQPNLTGRPTSPSDEKLQATSLPQVRHSPSRAAHGGKTAYHPSVEAAMTKTLKETGTPEWFTERLLPNAQQRLMNHLLEQARAKAASQGRTRQIKTVRADRLRRDMAVFKVLALGAFAYLETQGQKARAKHYTSVTYFTVLDALAAITSYGTTACEEAISDLRSSGLIATRRVYQQATFQRKPAAEGQPETSYTMQAITGVWLCVNLQPQRAHLRAMVLPSELPEESPRDLLADRKAGRTAYQLRQEAKEKGGESFPQQVGKLIYQNILLWALPTPPLEKSVKKDSPPFFSDTWDELDKIRAAVAAAHKEHPQRRREKVMQAAQVIGKVFKDENPISIKGYCRMIWRGIQGEMQQRPALQGLLDAIDRTLTFRRESRNDKRPLNKSGAYLRSVLLESGWLEREYHAI